MIEEEGEEASVIIPAEAAEEEEEEEDGDEEKSFLNFLKGDFDFDLLGGCIDGGGASDDGRGGGWRAVYNERNWKTNVAEKKCLLPFFLALYSTLSSLTRVGSDPYSMADPLQE